MNKNKWNCRNYENGLQCNLGGRQEYLLFAVFKFCKTILV